MSWSFRVYTQDSVPLMTGTFSSMHVSERSGDIVGMELSIVGSASGYMVVAQGTEGAPGTPVVLPLTLSGSVVEFAAPPACPCALREGRHLARIGEEYADRFPTQDSDGRPGSTS